VSRLDDLNIDAPAERGVEGIWPGADLCVEASPRPATYIEGIERPRAVAFVWARFSSRHIARCTACARRLADRFEVYGIELVGADGTTDIPSHGRGLGLKKVTLFPGEAPGDIGALRGARRIVESCQRIGASHVFLGDYDCPAIFLSAMALRLLRRRVVVMQHANVHSQRRRLSTALWKSLLYLPCNAALAAGPQTHAHLRFLGFSDERIFLGSETVSVERVRRLAGVEPAPYGVPHPERHITVATDSFGDGGLTLVLEAYAASLAAQQRRHPVRALHLVGPAALEPSVRAKVAALRLDHVRFRAQLDEAAMAGLLGSTLALVLPKIEEHHGLLVNQALAMGVPVLLADDWGARDLLVRSGVNGYVFERDNAAGLAHFLALLDRDEAEWARLVLGARRFLASADTPNFVGAVEAALDRCA